MRAIGPWLGFVGTLTALLWVAAPAWAQGELPELPLAAELPAPEATKLSPSDWEQRYDQARTLLRDGFFTAAAEELANLAHQAPDVTRKRVALEESWLALYWSKRGYVLQTRPGAPTDPALRPAPMHDRRSTDELAILFTSSVLYGLGSGVTLAVLTEPDSVAAGILPTLALGGLSAFGVYQLDQKVGLRYGAAQAMASGLFIGLEEGLAWVLWQQEYARFDNQLGAKSVTSILWASSTAGVIAGGLVGQLYGTTPGRASLVGSGALWTALVGGLGVAAVSDNSATALLSAAVVLNLGAVGGVFLGDDLRPSIARVRYIDLGGICGAVLFGGLYWAIADTDGSRRVFLGSIATGIGVGLLTAVYFTHDMQPDDPSRKRDASELSMVPVLAPSTDGRGGVLGLAGAF